MDFVRPHLGPNETIESMRNGIVEVEVQVAIVIRLLSGDTDLDLIRL